MSDLVGNPEERFFSRHSSFVLVLQKSKTDITVSFISKNLHNIIKY